MAKELVFKDKKYFVVGKKYASTKGKKYKVTRSINKGGRAFITFKKVVGKDEAKQSMSLYVCQCQGFTLTR